MFDNNKILALIPARGGSKGILRKNIKSFVGRPLLSYTILAAQESKYIDDIVVTTDSREISEVAEHYGAEVPFLRPAELATDESKTIDAVVHAVFTLKEMGREYDAVVLLQPTSPLRRASEIDEAVTVFYRHGGLGLASVAEVQESPILTRQIGEGGILHPILPFSSTIRRQDMPKFWHVDGAIYINSTSSLNAETSLNDNPVAYIMPEMRSLDIDDIDDFYQAESLFKKLEDVSDGVQQ